ncbi:hypothetical protein KFL_010800040 [Klebsormidium nitens]|uniref:Uncharacterized protein n=1 Tax=Klebsormidium nitens TaxID=105231 RepID=A0A1Y1IP39_KLENI|nr:hypothetical protein KFL_010800040 [Klebsormidium nitens]|eukprot:GAQ92640.1 hypothetical protein KFL_010800040 [Klebsormidium nitens]
MLCREVSTFGAVEETSTEGAASPLARGIKEQALRCLVLMTAPEQSVRVLLPTGSASPPLRLYMTAWDHNGEGRPKGLGKPSKIHALPETVWWSTLGELCCTCDRGRLMGDAPCVHKLAMAAFSKSWASTAELPTHESLGRGARVERVGSDETGSYFAVADNLQRPPSPQRRMVFRSSKGGWYCEGKRDGCPSLVDCSHVMAAKGALRNEGDLPVADQMVLRLLEPLSEAALDWLEAWNGELPKIGKTPAVGPPSQERDDDGLSKEERYLIELLERRPHERAACAGDSCFCRQHDRLFGEGSEQGEAAAHVKNARSSRGPGERRRLRRITCLLANGRGATRLSGRHTSEALSRRRKKGGALDRQRMRGGKRQSELLTTEAAQVTRPKLARPSDSHAVHDPMVASLDSPVPVSKLRDCHFRELSEKGLLSAPCPLESPACGGSWVEAWTEADVTASQWSQRVRVRIYHCQCLDEAHAIHFDGEHLGLYAWNRRTLFVQQSLQLLLRGMQHGHSFKAELATHQTAFQWSPDAAVLSEETWRRASLDFFKLVGLGLRDCCSLCGPHPKILLCDGIVGLASTDGAKKPGGLGSSSLDARRTFTHPSRHASGALLEKRSISGRDYCGAGLEGGGMKRKLLLQPELRVAIARLSRHRPKDEKVGEPLSRAEFGALLAGLAHDDATIVKRFGGPEEAEGPLSEDGRRRMLDEQQTMVLDRNRAVFELLTGVQADFERRGLSPDLWEHWVGEWTELLYSLGAHDADEDLIGSGALHVVRRLLLGGDASLEDRRDLARDAPILRRILDAYGGLTFPAFFTRTLYHLYLLALFARGATGFEAEGRRGWVHEAVDPFDQAVFLLFEGKVRPLTIDEGQQLEEVRGLANELLPGVERLEPSPEQWGRMSAAERILLRERLGRDENGKERPPLQTEHSFRAEQDELACYTLPGWEQRRGVPWHSSFEHPDGRSRTSEEFKCATGKTVTEWDAENVPGLVKGAGKLSGKKGSGSKRPKRTRGAFVFCCPHRIIYGFHIMLRGESPRDAFVVLFTRLRREDLPDVLVHDNACALRNYSMRREPAFFRDVRFVVDRFHFSKAGSEVHKCGPTNSPDSYSSLHWVNTSAVESVNSFLKGFRSLGWYSGLESLMVILPLLLGGYNSSLKRVDDGKLSIAIAVAVWTGGTRAWLLQR